MRCTHSSLRLLPCLLQSEVPPAGSRSLSAAKDLLSQAEAHEQRPRRSLSPAQQDAADRAYVMPIGGTPCCRKEKEKSAPLGVITGAPRPGSSPGLLN